MKRLLTILFLFGCANQVPISITIDPAFTEEQKEVILDSLDHTCRAVNFCPLITDDSENKIINEFNWGKHDCPNSWTGVNDGKNVYINAKLIEGDLERLWFSVTHELLHYGIEKHPVKRGLMLHKVDRQFGMCIDIFAALAWCKEQNETGCVSTCYQ